MNDALDLVRGEATAAARAFRLGTNARGHETFVRLVDALAGELGQPEHARLAGELGALLPTVLAAQQRGDLLRVADALEHEVVPLLNAR